MSEERQSLSLFFHRYKGIKSSSLLVKYMYFVLVPTSDYIEKCKGREQIQNDDANGSTCSCKKVSPKLELSVPGMSG